MNVESEYSAQNIQVLKGLEAVRKRPGMYIGSTGQDGLHHLVYELVDNSIDEALAGYCKNIRVTLEANGFVRVEDDGRGIPVGMHAEEGISALELVMTRLHAGGKFDKMSYRVSGGLHGVGVSVVNALSTVCEVFVHVGQKQYFQSYSRGIPVQDVQLLSESDKQGTLVRYLADETIFENIDYSFDTLSNRLRELAFLNKGVRIILCDERAAPSKIMEFEFEGGLRQFVEHLNKSKTVLHKDPIYFSGVKDNVEIEIGLQYNDGFNETLLTFVNGINTKEGGAHLNGFRAGMSKVFIELAKKSKNAKKLEDSIQSDDTREGLTGVLSIKLGEPQFEGQTKTKLGNPEVKSIIESYFSEKLGILAETNPELINPIIEKILLAARARIAAKQAKDLTRRKSFLESSGLPGKLADCQEKKPERCEIFIVEGDSAGGSAKMGRDKSFQAVLPLFGKMLNVEKTRIAKVIENEKLLPIIQSLGAGIGNDFDLSKLRYHKVVIMADADIDGSHIRTLLLTFFFRYMKELIENGHVFLAMPPLYRVVIDKKNYYVYNDEEKDKLLGSISHDPEKIAIQRYKGLGEMNPDQLWETTMDPERRNIMKILMHDAVQAELIFSTLMGEQVEPRRQFIEENALYVSNLDV